MAGKKAQGLPLNFIVLAAIAALVLILIIAFTVGGGAPFLSRIFKSGTTAVGDEIETVKTTCSNLCTQAQTISTTGAWDGTSFCSRKFNVDMDKDGKLGGYSATGTAGGDYNAATPRQKEKNIKCYESPISASCSVDISTPSGEIKTCISSATGCSCT